MKESNSTMDRFQSVDQEAVHACNGGASNPISVEEHTFQQWLLALADGE